MMFAARKLQGIGLIMLLTLFAMIVYPISLRVSATRAELQKAEMDIAEARQQNRMLEGDIAVLANVHQLDRWNAEFFGYASPTASQYLGGERELANLGSLRNPERRAVNQPVLAALHAETQQVDGARGDEVSGQERMALLDRRQVTASAARDIGQVMLSPTAIAVATSEVVGR